MYVEVPERLGRHHPDGQGVGGSGRRRNLHHGLLTTAVKAPVQETNDDDQADRFAIANRLRVNFYADALTARAARRQVDQIETVVDTLESIPSANGGSPP